MKIPKKLLLACVFTNFALANTYQSGLGFFIDTSVPACVASAKNQTPASDGLLQRYCFCMMSLVVDNLDDKDLSVLNLVAQGIEDQGLEKDFDNVNKKALQIAANADATYCLRKSFGD